MATYISQRVFTLGGTSKCLQIANNELVRKLHIGNAWNTIRVCVLCSVGNNGTAQDMTMPIAIGMCSNSGGYSPKTTPHWVGVVPTASSPWVYTANTGNPYYTFSGQMGRKVATTTTVDATGMSFNVASTVGTTQRRSLLYVEINRSYTMKCYSTSSSGISTDYTMADLLEGAEQNSTPTVKGFSLTGTSLNTIAGTESPGALDSISIYYGSNIFAFEIYGIAVYRML